jgi:DNA-binding response OmpR family regulator
MKLSTAVVVDDDPFSVRVLDVALRRYHFNLVPTSRAGGLTGLLEVYRPGLLFFDSALPGMDAAGLVRFLRKSQALAATTVLLYAARPEATLERDVSGCGADGFVMKSRDITALATALGRFLQR